MDLRARQEKFREAVLDLLDSVGDTLTQEERSEVQHLVDHNEIGEGLRSLMWIIDEEHKVVSEASIVRMLELADGLVDPAHLPEVFRKREPR